MTREPNIKRALPTPDEILARMHKTHQDDVAHFWMQEGPIVTVLVVIAALLAGMLTDTMKDPRLWVLTILVALFAGSMLYPRRPAKTDANVVRQVSALVRGVRKREQPAEVIRFDRDSSPDNLTRK